MPALRTSRPGARVRSMSTYELLLFGHLLAAMIWVGGGLLSQMYYLRARAAGPEAVGRFAKDAEWIGMRVMTPASLSVLIFGILLVLELDAYDFSQFWISAALAMFALSFLTGLTFLGPESGRIGKLSEELGAAHPDVQRRIGRVVVISRMEFFLLVLIVLDMVVKPGFP